MQYRCSNKLSMLKNQKHQHKSTCLQGCKVICEITAAMFATEFVNKLFEPQQLCSIGTVRQIFNHLAHSSIMRLSETRQVMQLARA
jgi:hypothetical protein